jgi:signal transduction histidine kinase
MLMLTLGGLALKSNPKAGINKILFAFGVSTVLWMYCLYLGFFFATPADRELALLFFRLTFGFGSVTSALLAAFFYIFPNKKNGIPKFVQLILILGATAIFLLAVFTPFIYESIEIAQEQLIVEDKLGSLYAIFPIYFLGNYLLAIFFAIRQIRNQSGINKARVLLASIGLFTTFTFTILSHIILPIFNIYAFQLEAGILPIFILITSFYAITKYRFMDIKFNLFKTLQFIAAFGLAISAEYFAHIYLLSRIKIEPFFTATMDIIIIFSSLFLGHLLLQTKFCQQCFNVNSVDYFRKSAEKLSRQRASYKTINELNKDLQKTFCREIGISFARVIILNSTTKNHYPELVAHCHHHHQVLVTREIQFFYLERNKNCPYLLELSDLGEVCLPLFYHQDQLAGFFVLGQKSDSSLYTEEEITAIEKLSSYLNFEVSSTLYGSELRAEVKEKTSKLAAQNKKNKELVRQQSDFIAVVAHELRTPLTIALNYFDSFKESLSSEHPKDAELSVAESALENLQKLIQKIFNVQQYDLDKVKLHSEKIDLVGFLTAIYENFLPLVKAKKLDFVFEHNLPTKQNPLIEIDPVQMRQVVQNLIRNALQFEPKKIIRLILETENKNMLIKIIDDGLGIPELKKQQIFKKFQSNPALQGKGIGLGLYLCQKIIDLHKGQIWIEDTPGGGATFVVSLPLE